MDSKCMPTHAQIHVLEPKLHGNDAWFATGASLTLHAGNLRGPRFVSLPQSSLNRTVGRTCIASHAFAMRWLACVTLPKLATLRAVACDVEPLAMADNDARCVACSA